MSMVPEFPPSVQQAMAADIAGFVARERPALFVWSPDGYGDATAAVPLFVGVLPAEPDTAVAVQPYPVTHEQSVVTYGFQFRARAPYDAAAMLDEVKAVLDGVERLALGGRTVPVVWLANTAQIGPDENGRDVATASYYAVVGQASAASNQ